MKDPPWRNNTFSCVFRASQIWGLVLGATFLGIGHRPIHFSAFHFFFLKPLDCGSSPTGRRMCSCSMDRVFSGQSHCRITGVGQFRFWILALTLPGWAAWSQPLWVSVSSPVTLQGFGKLIWDHLGAKLLLLVPYLVALVVKNPPANAGDRRDVGSLPGSGRSPGGGHGNLLQYSCLGNPMDRGAWQATVHGVEKDSDTT